MLFVLLRQVWFSIACVCACVCAIVFSPVILAVFSSLSTFRVCFALELPGLRRPFFFRVCSLPCVLLFRCGLLWFCLGCGFNFISVLWSHLWFSNQRTFKNGTQMLPKGLQNRYWKGYGGHLGALVDEGLIQGVIFDDFGSVLGALWDHFGDNFWNTFLVSF